MSGLYAGPSSFFILSFSDWMCQASKVHLCRYHGLWLTTSASSHLMVGVDMCLIASYTSSKVTSIALSPGIAMMWQQMKKFALVQSLLPLSGYI